SGKYSPAWVAQQLDDAAENAMLRLAEAKSRISDSRSPQFRRLAIDVPIQAGLGLFFAARFRSGVLYALYLRSGYRPALEAALKANRAARTAWAALAERAKTPYLPDITYGPEDFQRGQWMDRLPAIDADITDMEGFLKHVPEKKEAMENMNEALIEKAMRVILARSEKSEYPSFSGLHTPLQAFQPGQPLQIIAHLAKANAPAMISSLRLHYRHVNQAEIWRMTEMESSGLEYRAVIPADYTDSEFPLQYYFQISAYSDHAWLHPGLKPDWRGQPYFYVRQI
ncbi:MAG TPA: hypothetical protein VKA67_04940, partial [Verrucomicrobiae bacterium]|nr:hypothetical protein [Verrucomicrobiae bacterium]